MGKLVFLQNNRPVTDSLTIAETFGKEHRRVMQDIRELGCSEEFRVHHFVQSSYVNEQNRQMPKHIMTEQGFTLLVMGYTGDRAMEFKENYINEFHRMRAELNKPQFNLPQTFSEALRLAADLSEQKQALESKIEADRPLVAFAETCMDSDKNMLVREVAKLASKNGFMIGQTRLFRKLRDWGLMLQHRNEPTQRAMEMGLFEVIKGVKQTPKGARDWETSKVTPKGQAYIIDRLKRENLPMEA